MKRLIALSSIVVVLLGFSISHFVLAQGQGGGPPEIETVCHVTSSEIQSNGNLIFIGHVIKVPDDSGPLELHLEHGDEIVVDGTPGACCSFCEDVNGEPCPVRID